MRAASCLAALAAALIATPVLQAEAQPPPNTPADFLSAAAGADVYEIMAGRVALTESRDPAIRSFATRMVQDHGAAFAALAQAAAKSGLAPPPFIVGGAQTQLLAALQSKRGTAFDQAYAQQQVLAHVAALTTEGDYAAHGMDVNLRRVAHADLAMIRTHLRAASDLPGAKG